jgi:hypothetical protein
MKMKVELILEIPMAGGCGCSVSMSDRMALMKQVREQAQVWEKVKKGNKSHEYTRSVLTDQGPEHAKAALEAGSLLPLVFLDSELVHSGSYPSVEVFVDLLNGREQNT